MTVDIFYETGFNERWIPCNPELLYDTSQFPYKRTFENINIVQSDNLGVLWLEDNNLDWNRTADYCLIYDEAKKTRSAYAIVNYERRGSTVFYYLIEDPYNTAGGMEPVEQKSGHGEHQPMIVLSGSAKRISVPLQAAQTHTDFRQNEHDTFFTLDEPFEPSQRLHMHYDAVPYTPYQPSPSFDCEAITNFRMVNNLREININARWYYGNAGTSAQPIYSYFRRGGSPITYTPNIDTVDTQSLLEGVTNYDVYNNKTVLDLNDTIAEHLNTFIGMINTYINLLEAQYPNNLMYKEGLTTIAGKLGIILNGYKDKCSFNSNTQPSKPFRIHPYFVKKNTEDPIGYDIYLLQQYGETLTLHSETPLPSRHYARTDLIDYLLGDNECDIIYSCWCEVGGTIYTGSRSDNLRFLISHRTGRAVYGNYMVDLITTSQLDPTQPNAVGYRV